MQKPNKTIQFIVSFAIFMESLDSTILNTAIPSMSQALHVSPINLKIALISYLLMLAIFIPISGWLADKWGTKKIFLSALTVFTLSSFACGFAHGLVELIIMRSIQGIGGAFMMPIARLIMVRSAPRNELVKAMSQAMLLGSLGMMLGPVLGGVIAEYLSWSWIFFINIPIGIIAIIFTYYSLAETKPVSVPPFDIVGFILFGSGLALFIFGLSTLSESGFSVRYSFYFILAALLLLFSYAVYARRKKHAVINTHLFKYNTFKIGVFANLWTRIGFGGIPFLLPLMLQINFQYSPAQAGMLVMPLALGVMAAKSFTAKLLQRLGYRRYLISNTILVSFSVLSFAYLEPQTSWVFITIAAFMFGLLISQQYSGMNSLAYQEVNEYEISSATSFMGTLQQFAQSFGVAVAALLLHIGLLFIHSTEITVLIFKLTFIILSVLTFASLVIFFRLKNEQGLVEKLT